MVVCDLKRVGFKTGDTIGIDIDADGKPTVYLPTPGGPVAREVEIGLDDSTEDAEEIEDLIIEQIALYRRPVQPGWPQYREAGP